LPQTAPATVLVPFVIVLVAVSKVSVVFAATSISGRFAFCVPTHVNVSFVPRWLAAWLAGTKSSHLSVVVSHP
jgi:hypothetical protein